jgi:hypothetical protein
LYPEKIVRMKKILAAAFISLFTLSISAREFKDAATAQGSQIDRISNADLSLELPRFVFSYTNTKIALRFRNPMHDKLVKNGRQLSFIVNGEDQLVQFDADGVGQLTCTFKGDNKLTVLLEEASFNRQVPVISIWYMVLPLIALFLFLGYKLMFAKTKLKVVAQQEAQDEEPFIKTTDLKLVKNEEEALV